jgi:hypothetical protein
MGLDPGGDVCHAVTHKASYANNTRPLALCNGKFEETFRDAEALLHFFAA